MLSRSSAGWFVVIQSARFLRDGRSYAFEILWVGVTWSKVDHVYICFLVWWPYGQAPKVKGQVKFQLAPIGIKLGDYKPGHDWSMNRTFRIGLVKVIQVQGQEKFKLALIGLKCGESKPGQDGSIKWTLKLCPHRKSLLLVQYSKLHFWCNFYSSLLLVHVHTQALTSDSFPNLVLIGSGVRCQRLWNVIFSPKVGLNRLVLVF